MSGVDHYAWNSNFRERIIALALTPDWFSRFGFEVLKPEFFETHEEQDVVSAVLGFYKQYKRTPGEDELRAVLVGKNGALEVALNAYDCLEEDLDYARDNAIKFAQQQAMKIAVLASADAIRDGDLESQLQFVKEAQQVGLDLHDLGLDIKHDTAWAYEEVFEHKVTTGIYLLDIALGGGLAPGELGCIMAATGVGKTQTLVNIGVGAASAISNCNVAHVTLELSEKKTAKRYAARTTFKWIQSTDDPGQYVIKFLCDARLRIPGDIYIKEFPSGSADVADVDAYMNKLSMAGIHIGLLIVDYPDIMRHHGRGDKWEQIGDTFVELRGLAKRWNIPVWGGTQASRGALGKMIVTLNDIAESYKKAQISDVVLAMCQTQLEQDAAEVRYYAAKVRDGSAGWMVRCFVDKESHSIIGDEIITVEQLLEEKRKQEEQDG